VQKNRQRKAFGDEILGHAMAHQPEADEADAGLVAVHCLPF